MKLHELYAAAQALGDMMRPGIASLPKRDKGYYLRRFVERNPDIAWPQARRLLSRLGITKEQWRAAHGKIT